MSGPLPVEALPVEALTRQTDTVLTLRPAPKTHVTVRGLSKSFAGAPLYTNFNLDLPRGEERGHRRINILVRAGDDIALVLERRRRRGHGRPTDTDKVN